MQVYSDYRWLWDNQLDVLLTALSQYPLNGVRAKCAMFERFGSLSVDLQWSMSPSAFRQYVDLDDSARGGFLLSDHKTVTRYWDVCDRQRVNLVIPAFKDEGIVICSNLRIQWYVSWATRMDKPIFTLHHMRRTYYNSLKFWNTIFQAIVSKSRPDRPGVQGPPTPISYII